MGKLATAAGARGPARVHGQQRLDCDACGFVEPVRCDFRADFSFLESRRVHLTERRQPRLGLEALAYEGLTGHGAEHYRDLADRLSTARGVYVNPVAVLETLRKARDLFIDLGDGRFRAIAPTHSFQSPTDNLWLDPPPYRESSKDEVTKDARRLGTWLFVQQLGDAPKIREALAAVGHRGRYPTRAEVAAARQRFAEDRVAGAGLDLIEQLSRRAPPPPLDERFDVESIARLGQAARRRIVEANLRLVADQDQGLSVRIHTPPRAPWLSEGGSSRGR